MQSTNTSMRTALSFPAVPAPPRAGAARQPARQERRSHMPRIDADDVIYAATMLSFLLGAAAAVLWAARTW